MSDPPNKIDTTIKKDKPFLCPICKKTALPNFSPFCSKRCSLIDLGNWLKGSYAIPTEDFSKDLHQEKETD